MSQETGQYPITIGFTTKDMRKTVAYWRDTLGFKMAESWPDAENPKWVNFMLDRQSVMFGALLSPEESAKMCAGDAEREAIHKTLHEEFQRGQPGIGTILCLQVPDVDGYHATISKRGAKPTTKPKTQFYGLREFMIQDPNGYRVSFHTPVKVESCGSCGMPLKDAKPGQMYCGYCADDAGKLKPYEVVLEGTIQGFFMDMKKMPRPQAEKAAREHLAKMPAWAARK
ncbi:MAG TPA: VOC family protein [Planctomycetota bacterium]|jgi:uncharacterized glyoxalase superfamily protein PhnB|nr:VOC family protein [Planctomycetota bacterium]